VATEMRKSGETVSATVRDRMWNNVYHDGLLSGS
jgi:hypothetical protein